MHAEGGTVKSVYELPEIRYHALLAHLPIVGPEACRHDYTQLIKSDDVISSARLVRSSALPWCLVWMERLAEVTSHRCRTSSIVYGGASRRSADCEPCVVGGSARHNDPDDWGADYQTNEQQHGTAMASLILHGELDSPSEPLSCSLYVRPILKPERSSFGGSQERMPTTDGLVVDLMYRALRRMFEEKEQETPRPRPLRPMWWSSTCRSGTAIARSWAAQSARGHDFSIGRHGDTRFCSALALETTVN